jgi:hypothetical protein
MEQDMARAGRKRKIGVAREPNGQIVRRPAIEKGADNLVLTVRARMAGITPDAKGLAEMRNPMAGCDIGRELMKMPDSQKAYALWEALKLIERTVQKHDAAIKAPRRYAKGPTILSPVERMETSADAPAFDERSDEEKYLQAKAEYDLLQKWLRRAIDGGRETRRVCIDREDQPLRNWPYVLSGLLAVSCGSKGKLPT